MTTIPPDYLPIFGTVSVASVLALVVLAMKFFADVKKSIAEFVRKDDGFIESLAIRERALIAAISKEYVTQHEYADHHARLKHLEASCPNCSPLKDTKAVRRGDAA